MRRKRKQAYMALILLSIWIFYQSFDNLKKLHYQYFVQPYEIKIIEWVCIPQQKVKNICRPPTNHLLVHKAISNYKATVKGQIVEFTSDDIPEHYKILSDRTAIFHGYDRHFYPWNLYHFVNQFYVPFHHLLNEWKTLNLTPESDIFLSKPLSEYCRKGKFPSFFLGALGKNRTARFGYNYNAHPGNVCYRYGLFSDDLYPDHKRSAVEHLRHYHGVEETPCPTQNHILLLQRQFDRKWLNIDDVQRALVQAGYINTSIVNFDLKSKISLKDQLRVVYCAVAFIAPHSAGMEWTYFMKPHSTAIEIVWSRYGWVPFNDHRTSLLYKIPLNFISVETEDVLLPAYSVIRVTNEYPQWVQGLVNLRFNILFTDEQLNTMYIWPYFGKFDDFRVDPEGIVHAVKKSVKLR